jgi:hypothetical protein
MSSNMVPEADNFFTRLANNWYGSPQNLVDQGSYSDFGRALFLPEPDLADLSTQPWWNPDIPSDLSAFGIGDPGEPLGYIRFNTGRPTMDAIASVVVNNVGIDNLLRAKSGVTRGDWSEYFKEVPLGIVEALLSMGGVNVATGTAKRLLSRQVIKSGGGPIGGGGWRNPLGPTPVTTTLGPRPITQIPAAARAARARVGNAIAARTTPGQPIRNVARVARGGLGAAVRAGRAAPGRFALGAAGLAGLGFILDAGIRGEPRTTASEIRAMTEDKDPAKTSRPEPELVPGGSPEADATNQARVNIAGINQQYNNILRELQGMYQLSETEEERERLRFMLADIEAQRDAGLQAISEGYAQTVGQIREQAVLSAARTTERAGLYGEELEASAERAAQRMMLQNAEQQQQFRGLGSGSQSPVNEWVGLMSAMAPAQQLYTQRMGDISQEGMEWLANTVGAQGQAQGADLQRLAAATRSGTIANQQAQVSDRINRERELQRAAILQTMQQQAGAFQSAEQFNASLSGQGVNNRDVTAYIEEMLIGNKTLLSADDVQQGLFAYGYGEMTPAQRAYAERLIVKGQSTNQPSPNATS